jgi:hypothetical protein
MLTMAMIFKARQEDTVSVDFQSVCQTFSKRFGWRYVASPIAVIRQYSSVAESKQNTIAKRYRSGSAGVFVLAISPCGFSFQLGNLSAHLRNLPLHSFLGHKE